jgi:Na+/proline symporter
MIKHSMNRLFLLCICAMALASSLFAQVPSETPIASSTVPTAATAATAATSIAASASTPTAAPSATSSSASSDLADRIHRKLEKKLGRKHGIVIDGDDDHEGHSEDIPAMVIPLVAIVFMTIFGAPVLIVIMIGIIALVGTRMRQRTVRMMLEKGQPVPAELLAPSTRGMRRRSDMRRGVVWTMVGLGLMIWLAAVNDWEGGAWSFGLIPFLIGLGYLIVWKLENKKDIPPPPPAP